MKTKNTLPILLKNKKILLIGGGNVALQKAIVLADNNIEFKIISKEFKEAILSIASNRVHKSFRIKDIEDYFIIIDATGNKKIAKKLLKYKKANDILLNIVDAPKYCDFYFMALTPNKPLQIAVTSNGASPTAAKYFRDECAALIPKDIGKYLKQKQKHRDNGIIDIIKTKEELNASLVKVYLIGCGLGDSELLTIKAYKTIQSVDVVLYDHLISQEVMDLVPKRVTKIYVGKEKDYHTKPQEEINALIVKYVNKNKIVARLKSGDPFVFGRGSEELEYLIDHNIKAEVISGISSSISGCTYAGIPITARGYASGFSVVSGHLQGNKINLDWINLLNKKNHTVVVLMGLSNVNEIVKEAKNINIALTKHCAIISNATRPNQKVVTTTLENLAKDSTDIQRPAILVFGDVVKFHSIFK
jgi:uroporphyrin-III C-methyltransferase/precorrin-2 dehydrogenase/sirohydrochlorin ferrochelatase